MEKNYLLIRFSEIATKSGPVKQRMEHVLRQRIKDLLDYEGFEFGQVSNAPGRILVKQIEEAEEAAEKASNVPGVASTSPAIKVESNIEEMKKAADSFEIGKTFGIEASRSGKHEFTSQEIERELGDYVRKQTGSEVDLDSPDTWLEADIRFEDTFMFNQRFEGPDGVPVGSGNDLAALVSGGIDSPVAAYEVMKRGSDIVPIYIYNLPVAAEDHFLRFKSVVEELKKFNPTKIWTVYKVDFEEVNKELMNVEKGRMVLHRILMFKVAEKIAEKEGLKGLVTGEALCQKSSQTAANMKLTTGEADLPVFRPLLTHSKNEITEKAKELGTFEYAEIASACSTIAPDRPATKLRDSDLAKLKREAGFEDLLEKAEKGIEEIEI